MDSKACTINLKTMVGPVSQKTPKEGAYPHGTNGDLARPCRTNSDLALPHRTDKRITSETVQRDRLVRPSSETVW
jgi:hypothetical protein